MTYHDKGCLCGRCLDWFTSMKGTNGRCRRCREPFDEHELVGDKAVCRRRVAA